jgi:hypothetical protein
MVSLNGEWTVAGWTVIGGWNLNDGWMLLRFILNDVWTVRLILLGDLLKRWAWNYFVYINISFLGLAKIYLTVCLWD